MAAEFDDRLKERLLAFQNHHGLTGSGVVDTETWRRLTQGASGVAAAAQHAGAGHQPEAGRPGEGGAGAGTCDCEADESAMSGNGPVMDEGDPPELVGVLEENPGDDDPGEDPGNLLGDDVGLQARGGHRQTNSSVPAQCRANARACFSVSQQKAWLLRTGRGPRVVVAVPALGGRPGHPTPTGQFTVHFHDANHYSSKYHAPMPFYVNFAPQVGFHAGSLSVRSHGCVHLSRANAERFFNYLNDGDPVDVVP